MHLEGSCHCGAVRFSLEAHSPVPFLHCHCSICRKTAGGGGYAINLGGDAATLKVKGAKHLGCYHALMRDTENPGKRAIRSKAERRFCLKCGSALWLFDPRWPELVHPHASAIDTPLPKPPEVVEAALVYAANWVDVPKGEGHVHEQHWPQESLAQWHQRHQLDGL
ncbi:GFA family protein [Variovorax sp. HJSM1_2]|uniref:GFA family protein n=1 Tax=Variovorax sp. HJSM1_2 TaxID=3366263 RepID=UPI003BE56EC7